MRTHDSVEGVALVCISQRETREGTAMRVPIQSLVIAWSVACAACATHREDVREADLAAMNAHGGETESLCPAPPRAIGGGPAETSSTGSISLGSVTTTDDAARGTTAPRAQPRASTNGASGSGVPAWWTTPPPVVIENGPSPTIGPGGSGFTIQPGY
jgi:hypothetical protein